MTARFHIDNITCGLCKLPTVVSSEIKRKEIVREMR